MSVTYRDGALHLDYVPIEQLAAEFGTPLYAYSQRDLIEAGQALDAALAGSTLHLVCYAVKANPNLAVIGTFARMGFGADVTSGGELYRAVQAGVTPEKIVFSGVGKTDAEIEMGLEAGIKAFHVESISEMESIAETAAARMDIAAPIALRVNVNVDPHTHPNISTGKEETKFGIHWDDVPEIIKWVRGSKSLRLVGLSVHIGSQITELGPYRQAADRILRLARELLDQEIGLEYIDFGGGLGVQYSDEAPPSFASWGQTMREVLGDLPLQLLVEPGRSLVAGAGMLITRVLRIKEAPTKRFMIVDAGMNDLIRPMLYSAYHPIWPVREHHQGNGVFDIVGPVCETTDIFAAQRQMPEAEAGDLLTILQAGAYGSSMASNYNSRLRPAEVMIGTDGKTHVIRARDTYQDLVRGEHMLPPL